MATVHVIKPHSQTLLAMCGVSLKNGNNWSHALNSRVAADLTVIECKDREVCEDCMKELSNVLAR